MKGLFLAGFSFLVLVVLSLIFLRFYRGKKYYRMFLLAFIGALGIYVYLQVALPDDLGFLPRWLVESRRAVDFWNGLLVLLLIFHIYWDVAYATALTGFSSNLMILLSRPNGLSMGEILEIYGAGSPLDRVLLWRLDSLLRGKYLKQEASGFRILTKGKTVARFSRFLKHLYGIKERGDDGSGNFN